MALQGRDLGAGPTTGPMGSPGPAEVAPCTRLCQERPDRASSRSRVGEGSAVSLKSWVCHVELSLSGTCLGAEAGGGWLASGLPPPPRLEPKRNNALSGGSWGRRLSASGGASPALRWSRGAGSSPGLARKGSVQSRSLSTPAA